MGYDGQPYGSIQLMPSEFPLKYDQFTDDELLRLSSDRSLLTSEANAALDAEMRKRGLTAEDFAKYQHRVNREQRLETKKRVRKVFGSKWDWEGAIAFFWTGLALALIRWVYI